MGKGVLTVERRKELAAKKGEKMGERTPGKSFKIKLLTSQLDELLQQFL